MKLIPMIDFVFEIGNLDKTTHKENLANIYNYAMFLKRPLELWMFVPCDENGNVLHKNPCEVNTNLCTDCDCEYNFKHAKNKCLFKDCLYDRKFDAVRTKEGLMVYSNKSKYESNNKIEHLTQYDLQLSQNAIKTI